MMRLYQVSPIPYSFLHQRPQKLADELRRKGIPVTYIEPCGLREFLAGRRKGLIRHVVISLGYHLLGIGALLIPALRKKPAAAGGARPRPDLEIITMPLIIPNNRVNSEFLERLNASIYRQVLKRKVFRRMARGEDSVALVQNPFYGLVIDAGDFEKVFYDCLDEISLYAGRSSTTRFLRYERRLITNSNALFVTAKALEEHLGEVGIERPVHRVPNGVDAAWFASRSAAGPEPEDLRSIPRPIAGYVGVIYDWLDYSLIATLARRLPDVSFVFVGPVDYEWRIADLRSCGNIHWLGRKEYADIPLYLRSFSVCLIPFRTGKISQTTNPVKVFEYFALGKPVVATRLKELEPFADQGLLAIADTVDEYVDAVVAALGNTSSEDADDRKRVAREHSWQSHAEKMIAAFTADLRGC